MGQFLLLLVVALVAATVVFGVVTLIGDAGQGLSPAEPDGRAVPLPGSRPLAEGDLEAVRFDTSVRGYRMAQVDQALRRAAYDIGYKVELIAVLEAEVGALREGRTEEAESLRQARAGALNQAAPVPVTPDPAAPVPVTPDPAAPDPVASAAEVTSADGGRVDAERMDRERVDSEK